MLNQQVSFGGQFYTPEVLILDDEPDFVDVMKDYVDPSAKVSAFTSPQEAMKRMESGHWPDVIVLDWMDDAPDGWFGLFEADSFAEQRSSCHYGQRRR